MAEYGRLGWLMITKFSTPFLYGLIICASWPLSSCSNYSRDSENEFKQCFSTSIVEKIDGVYFLSLTEELSAKGRPNCTDMFNILSVDNPEKARKIVIASYQVKIGDIYYSLKSCNLTGELDTEFLRWQVSDMLRECPDFYVSRTLSLISKESEDIGNFRPSNYRNEDISVIVWTDPNYRPHAMTAGIFESLERGVVPVCLHFRDMDDARATLIEPDLRSPAFSDELETCLMRFVNLN